MKDITIKEKYRVDGKIGKGSFGLVYAGTDLRTNEEVAIKLVDSEKRYIVDTEAETYKLLSGGVGISQLRWVGQENTYSILVFDALGPSLQDLLNYCDRRLSLKTILLIADQAISRVQYVHSKGIIHRDIKPENLLMGVDRKGNVLYMIDFGLAIEFSEAEMYRDGKSINIGTSYYASLNNHNNMQQSWRDDLESLGYVLLYLAKGSLPWNQEKTDEAIKQKKMDLSVEELCEGLPNEFATYIKYARSLGFDDLPDYAYLRRLFRRLYQSRGFKYDSIFDWTEKLFNEAYRQKVSSDAVEGAGAQNNTAQGDEHSPSAFHSPDRGLEAKVMKTHHLEEIFTHSRDHISVDLRWNDARLVVHLHRSPSSTTAPPIENVFIDRQNDTDDGSDDEKSGVVAGEIFDAIVDTGRSLFDQLAPPMAPGVAPSHDLHSLLFPQEHNFSFQTMNGKAGVIHNTTPAPSSTALLGSSGVPFHLKQDEAFSLPIFSTKSIHVLEDLYDDGYVSRVMVEGKEMCAKAGALHGQDVAQRELDCLWKITTSANASALRIPKLLGLIEAPDTKQVIGFLVEYIPVPESSELSTLGSIKTVSAIDRHRRMKWASQIRETIQSLHHMGITWGDGKAGNVLIHRETDDAWVIDFGGGWTEGWLDEELSGTVEGDEVALRKIEEYLEL